MLLSGMKIRLELKTLMDTNQMLFTDDTIHPLLIVSALVSFHEFHEKRETIGVLFLSSDSHQIRHMGACIPYGADTCVFFIRLNDVVHSAIFQIVLMARMHTGLYDFSVVFSRHHLHIIGMVLQQIRYFTDVRIHKGGIRPLIFFHGIHQEGFATKDVKHGRVLHKGMRLRFRDRDLRQHGAKGRQRGDQRGLIGGDLKI